MEKPPVNSEADTWKPGDGLVILYTGERGGGIVLPPLSRNEVAQYAIAETIKAGDKKEE